MIEVIGVTRHWAYQIFCLEVLHTNGTLRRRSAFRLLTVLVILLLVKCTPVIRVAVLKTVNSVCEVFSSVVFIVKRLKIFEDGKILFVGNDFRVLVNQLLLIFPKTCGRERHGPAHNFANCPPRDPEEQNSEHNKLQVAEN